MPNGIIIIDKPQDWTSMDVCAKLRGVLGERRIGHAGTLDPMATGVLPVFVGRATRGVEFAERGDKEYVAGLKLGRVTDTQDTSGNTLEEHPVEVTAEQVRGVLPQFTGDILQVPPMYSAIKIGGKKLYELARKGKEVERPARPVTIHALTLEGQTAPDEFTIRVKCSKGTYVRTLCHDIGAALGCGGCMSSLRRTMACGYDLHEAHPLQEVLETENPAGLLLSTDTLFEAHPALTLGKRGAERVRHGAQVHQPEADNGTYRIYGPEEEFLALGRVEQGKLHIIKSFFDPT